MVFDKKESVNMGEGSISFKMFSKTITEVAGLLADKRHCSVINISELLDKAVSDIGHLSVKKGRGEYVGTFTKRLSKWVKKNCDYNLPKEFLRKVGDTALRDVVHSEIIYDFTRRFNWDDGDYGDGGSCFWGDRADAKDMILDADGFAFRTHSPTKGRVWGIPRCKGFFLFNSYGYQLIEMARIFCKIHGFTYKQVSLTNKDDASGQLYINDGKAVFCGEQSALDKMGDHYDFEINNPQDRDCDECGRTQDNGDLYYLYDGAYCSDCIVCCTRCEQSYPPRTDMQEVVLKGTSREGFWCEDCIEENAFFCEECEQLVSQRLLSEIDGMCAPCFKKNYISCNGCGGFFPKKVAIGDACEECYSAKFAPVFHREFLIPAHLLCGMDAREKEKIVMEWMGH